MIKLILQDWEGLYSTAYIDPQMPYIYNEHGDQIIDFTTHPYRAKPRSGYEGDITSVKRFTDTFLAHPSPGLPVRWFDSDNPKIVEINLANFIEAIEMIMCKQVIQVDKYVKKEP